MTKISITIDFDRDHLDNYTDEHLAALWHLAQANPAPLGDAEAGEIAEYIGREIIRRWLLRAGAAMWNHQGRDHYWKELIRFAHWDGKAWVAGAPAHVATSKQDCV